jgi:hypothetical protein
MVSAWMIYMHDWWLGALIIGGAVTAGVVSATAARRAGLDDSAEK